MLSAPGRPPPPGDSMRQIEPRRNNILAVREAFGSLKPEIVALFRDLWAKPELSGLEVEAMRQLSGFLERHGFSVHRAAGNIPTAFTAVIKTGNGPRIAFLAEYDALPGLANSATAARDALPHGRTWLRSQPYRSGELRCRDRCCDGGATTGSRRRNRCDRLPGRRNPVGKDRAPATRHLRGS